MPITQIAIQSTGLNNYEGVVLQDGKLVKTLRGEKEIEDAIESATDYSVKNITISVERP